MANIYDFKDVKEDLEKTLDRQEVLLNEWKKVTFPTKKDGKPFAIMSKNINGAKYQQVSYAMQPGENELWIGAFSTKNGYVSDTIKCYEHVNYLYKEEQKAKTENYLPKITYLEQVYCFDLEDIKEAVQERIEYIENYIQDLKWQISKAEEIYQDFKKAYFEAMETLERKTETFKHKDLYYDLKDLITSRYPYC